MKKQEKKNIFTITLCSIGVILIAISAVVIIFVLAAGDLQKRDARIINQSPETENALKVYVISGEILDIQGRIITLEAPVFDSINKRWDEEKKEIRRLEITDRTKFFKNSQVWLDEKKRFDKNVEIIMFEDLKIGDFADANYSENLVEIKDFSPETITILSN